MTKPNNNKAARGKNRKGGNVSVKLRPEEERELLARQLGLKRKTRELVDNLLENPQKTNAEVYMMNHKTVNKNTASNAVTKLLKKPSVIGYSNLAVGKAKRAIVSLVDSENESIKLKASQDIIDRNEGKAVQKNESISRVVEVKLDLSGTRIGAHYVATELLTPETTDPVS